MDLNKITSPDDIKNLSIKELESLAIDIRQFLIEKLSYTGGHLAPNLGVVELTIALHYLFESPKDKIIWDVGHQCYVHKILTGRADQFDTLRQFNGLSGFPKLSESPHDVFETGHSSTSLSSAMGFAISRDFKNEKNRVIAILGDGALTGGMALEALNYIGHQNNNLMIILNDNKMSISPNVGAINNYLERIRTNTGYQNAKKKFKNITKKIPLGDKIFDITYKIRDSFKYLIVEGVLFEELGLTYLGPVDGHDFESLFETLRNADNTEGPVLVHVLTEKGRGYLPAEINPNLFHGIGKYDINTGDVISKKQSPSYTDVFGNTMLKIAKERNDLFVITAAMPTGTGLDKFKEDFPERFLDVGIAEQHAVTMAAGIAISGLCPVFAVYSTFLQRAYDQVLHDVARQNLHVVFAVDRAGIVGNDGDTHHGVFDIAFLRSIPNMIIMMPKDENELQHMLYTAVEFCKGPVAIRYARAVGTGIELDEQLKVIPIGKYEVVREGKEIAILALGPMIQLAEKAAEELDKLDIHPLIINSRFIKPLDEELLLKLAKENYKILTIEEGVELGGFGSSILEFYSRNQISIDVEILGIQDKFVTHGDIPVLRNFIGLSVENIINRVKMIDAKLNQMV
ncbi:MAG: 1-deoxy-D-xylulose-5-phosphate synthase [Vulcanibacillus sp.]